VRRLGVTATDYSLPVDVSWELDVWGRIHRSVESNQASAQASAADLETSRLSIQAELAQDYVQLRSLDAQKQRLDTTIMAYTKALELMQNRYVSGVASRADVVQAESQLRPPRRRPSTSPCSAPSWSTRSRCSLAHRRLTFPFPLRL
jgi:outer membrane protein TolC